jgi:hypothetical protein
MLVYEDSDDETVAEIEIENPFIKETDPRLSPLYPSANVDASALEDDSDTDSQLVTTSYLDQFDLAFNRKYKLIICQPCGSGVPLVALHKHLTTTSCERMMWQEHVGIWKSTKVVLPHQPSVTSPPPKTAFTRAIVESLQEADLIHDQCDILSACGQKEWFEASHALTPPISPAVIGLRVFHNAYQCHICEKIHLTWNSISSHYSKAKHGGSVADAFGSKTVQTLTENRSYISYFEVVDNADQSDHSPSLSAHNQDEDDFLEAERLLEAKQRFVMPLVKTATPTSDLRQVLPVYHELRIHEFLSRFSDIRPTLRRPFQRQPKNDKYRRLQKIIVETFKTTMDRLPHLHNSIRMYITNCNP